MPLESGCKALRIFILTLLPGQLTNLNRERLFGRTCVMMEGSDLERNMVQA
jgi:hypothetical protein